MLGIWIYYHCAHSGDWDGIFLKRWRTASPIQMSVVASYLLMLTEDGLKLLKPVLKLVLSFTIFMND